MRLTTRRRGSVRRINLVDALAKALHDNVRLTRKVTQLEADLALARSSAVEWRDRYQSAKDPHHRADVAFAGWGSSRELGAEPETPEALGAEVFNSRPLLNN